MLLLYVYMVLLMMVLYIGHTHRMDTIHIDAMHAVTLYTVCSNMM